MGCEGLPLHHLLLLLQAKAVMRHRGMLQPQLVCASSGIITAPSTGHGAVCQCRSRARLSVCVLGPHCTAAVGVSVQALCVQFAAAQLGAGAGLSVFSLQQSFRGMQPRPGCSGVPRTERQQPRGSHHHVVEPLGHPLEVASCPEGSQTEPPHCSGSTGHISADL